MLLEKHCEQPQVIAVHIRVLALSHLTCKLFTIRRQTSLKPRQFFDTYVTQGSVATCFGCDGL